MKARIASLLSIVIIACSEETPVQIHEPLPQKTLQFESTSLTLMEAKDVGLANLETVVVLTNEAPQEVTQYYVTMKYKATDLGGGNFASRFAFHGGHKKFDGTMSLPVIVKSTFDQSGVLTTVIQMEFEKNNTSSYFKIGVVNNDQTDPDEIVEMEVVTTNPVSGACPNRLKIGEHNTLKVTLQDFQ